MSERPLTIALVATETSGDILGMGLIYALKARHPNIHCVGVAGPRMREAGCETWYEMEELTVMGIVEVLGNLSSLLKIRRELIRRFIKLKPDVFVGIDAPDFNLTLEGHLKKVGIRTVHYVSPSIWAWRKNRIFKIGRNTNLVLSFLPFEKAFYDLLSIPCRFIGHSMADKIPLQPDKLAARRELGITIESSCLSLLPGSRNTELEMLGSDFLYAAQLLRWRYPELKILVPLVNSKHCEQFAKIKAKVTPELPIHLIKGKSSTAMIASDVAMIASGTATLECMLAKCPMVVGYRMKPFTYWIAKHLVKTSYISLPNILANQELVKELIQDECKPVTLAAAVEPFLYKGLKRDILLNAFNELHKKIRCNADAQAADAVLNIANK